MKLKTTVLILTALLLRAPLAQAQNMGIPQQSDPAAQAVIMALIACGEQKLGGQAGVDMAKAMGDQANRQIVAYCREGNKSKAHDVAAYYAGTDEGKILMECAAQLRPLVEQPAVQQLLGVYKPMVNDILNGSVPQDVCVGVKQVRSY